MNRIWEFLPPSMPDASFMFEDDKVFGFRGSYKGKNLNVVSRVTEDFQIAFSEDAPFSEALPSLTERVLLSLGNPERASLVFPDTMFRMQIVEIENFPKDREEIAKILLWQARRNLAHPDNNLRVRYKILEKEGDFVKLWLCAASEPILALFEKTFKEKKCHIGFITSPTIAVSEILSKKGFFETNDVVLVMSITSKSLTFLFFKDGKPLFFRTKDLREDTDFEERVAQEIKLTLLFQKEKLSESPLRKV
ncbi:MAG: hypothetical protein N2445_07790, partial [Acidobacteria bacterium]|nr:hypothetical protein [Acidobacteriota bacterium]